MSRIYFPVLVFFLFVQLTVARTITPMGSQSLETGKSTNSQIEIPGAQNQADSSYCIEYEKDSISRFVKYKQYDAGYFYFLVNLSMFSSEFERYYFYQIASGQELYLINKTHFTYDSAIFFTKSSDQQSVANLFHKLYSDTKSASLLFSVEQKLEVVKTSPIYKAKATGENPGLSPMEVIPCETAQVSCSGNVYSFPAGTSGTAPLSIDGYPHYGCLGSQPAPVWYFMQVNLPGNIIIDMQKTGGTNNDIDFICWGPFNSLTEGCAVGLTGECGPDPKPNCCNNTDIVPGCAIYPSGNIVDCSYSGNANETCHILNAQVGKIYILLITNFSQAPGMITFSETVGTTGTTNCNIVIECSFIAITTNPSVCDEETNTYSISGNIEFTNPPAAGTLTISDNSGAFQSFSPPFTSPKAYNITGIPCDGVSHTVTASFSDDPTCTLSTTYSAPFAICPEANISGGGAICDDGIQVTSISIDFPQGTPPFTFIYAIDGANQPAITHNNSTPYIIETSTPGTYTLASVSNLVCTTGIVGGSATVTLKPLPVPSLSGAFSVCQNISGKVYTTDAEKTNYTWIIPPEATVESGGSPAENFVSVTWNTVGTYAISVNYTDPATQCTATTATSVNVTVKPLPVPSISGAFSVCQNVSGKVYTTDAEKTNYVWTIPPSATIASGGTLEDNYVNVTWTTVGSFSIGVNYTDPATQCTATTATSVDVTVKPLPVPSISGAFSVCQNISGKVYTTDAEKTNYVWTIPPSATIASGGTLEDNYVNVTWTTVGSFSIGVNYTDPATQCTATTATSVDVTVKPLPNPALSGPVNACVNTPGPVYTTDAGMSDYTWIVNGGTYSAGLSPDIINVTWTSTGTKNLTVNYTALNGCTAPAPSSLSVDVNTLPVPTITTGPDNICTGILTSYSTQPEMSGYAWTVTPDGTFTGGNSSQIVVSWDSPGTKQITVNYQMGPGCSGAIPATKTIIVNQSTPPVITSPVNPICLNSGTSYTTQAGMSNYTWTVSPGGTFTPSAGNVLNVNWNTAGAQYVSVNFTNTFGCVAPSPTQYNLTVNPLPVTTITSATGPDCALQTHVYQTPADPLCNFQWSATSGSVVAGQGTNSASINWLSPGPATVSVTGTIGTTGCISSSSFLTTVYPSPATTFTTCFDLVTTQNAKPFALKGGLPLGTNGKYTIDDPIGTPVISFDPATTGLGSHTVFYTYTNNDGCISRSQQTIVVNSSNASFVCGGVLTDPRDNSSYQTTLIGAQCWMKENLRYSAPAPYVSTPLLTPQTDNCTFERYCLDSDPTCTSFGGFYQWNELMQYNDDLTTTRQGFCPPGWHIPSSTEWQEMIDANQGNGIAGGSLKDMFGNFASELSGIGYFNNLWAFTLSETLNATLFWTSTLSAGKPIVRGLNSLNSSVSTYESSKANAFPVRCVKDN